MTRRLLIDNSNTRTKFTLAEGHQLLGEVRSLPTADITPDALQSTLHGWEYEQAILCSVVPRTAAILRAAVGCAVSEVTAQSCPGLVREYPEPATLGADRIANAAAAASHYPLPCIAVDLGTACTFDLIDMIQGEPRFIGGVIAPGRMLMAAALAEKTALLPLTHAPKTDSPAPIGRSTQEAIQAGIHYGYAGMVQGIIRELSRRFREKPFVVLTGGDSASWHDMPDGVDSIDSMLTFKGMLSIFP